MVVSHPDSNIQAAKHCRQGTSNNGTGRRSLRRLFGSRIIVIYIFPPFADSRLQQKAQAVKRHTRRNKAKAIGIVKCKEIRDSCPKRNDTFLVDRFKIGKVTIMHMVRHHEFARDGRCRRLVGHRIVGVPMQNLVERRKLYGILMDKTRICRRIDRIVRYRRRFRLKFLCRYNRFCRDRCWRLLSIGGACGRTHHICRSPDAFFTGLTYDRFRIYRSLHQGRIGFCGRNFCRGDFYRSGRLHRSRIFDRSGNN